MTEKLPAGWLPTTLGHVVDRPRPKSAPVDHPDLPFVGMDSIAPGSMSLLSVGRFGDMKSAGGIFEVGDVLYGRMRPYLNKVHRARQRGGCSAEFIVMPPSAGIAGDFLAYLLHQREFVNFASEQSSGDRPRVDFESLSAFSFGLPPKAEQQRIVSRIEELFSEIDEGERALERVGRLVERYRQSVLKSAVTGELTRQWRAMHAGPSVSASDDLPAGWRRVTVEELCPVQTGATPKRGEARYFDNGTIPWVTSGAVNVSRITEATELITRAAIDETNAKVFPAGTLIVAMYGEGKTRGKISELGIAAATNQACAALLCADLEPEVKGYLRLFFEQHYDELRGQAAGGVQPNLNLSLIKQTVLPLPPQPEAREICNQVAVQLSQAEALRQELTRRRGASVALRQSILKAAFSGQLVPQDPRDEPASALLAHLAAQASDAPATPRRRGRPAGRRSSQPNPEVAE